MYAGLGVMFLLWTVASAYWMLVVFAVVFGACYGAYVALLPTIVMDLYGPRSVSGIIAATRVARAEAGSGCAARAACSTTLRCRRAGSARTPSF